MNLSVIVIDDDKSQREVLSGFIQDLGCKVQACDSGTSCIEYINNNYVDLVITDFRMPELNGLQVLKKVKEINKDIAVIMITAYGSIEDSVNVMKAGAWDYFTKPVELEELQAKLEQLENHKTIVEENQVLKEQLKESVSTPQIIFKSHEMEDALNMVARVSNSEAAILILGESGTGKELITKTIHDASERRDKPFVAVNCAAIPENLFESELFGHEKGSFTGAHEQRKGKIEIAQGGTLFLDEVGDIPLSFQVKLLRVLQEKTFQRVGSNRDLHADIRIISATNKNLEKSIEEATFRADLFFRLNVIPITLPALRERKDDIKPLVDHFIQKHSKINNRDISSISTEGYDLLMRYDYPGNVRELENIIERAVILARSNIISVNELPIKQNKLTENVYKGTLPQQVEQFEKNLIKKALRENNNIQTAAAKKLGISEATLRYKINKYS